MGEKHFCLSPLFLDFNYDMKKFILFLTSFILTQGTALAQGWPAQYEGVMLQGFYWDSFIDTRWKNLEAQSDELAQYFSLIWVPQSGNCNSTHNTMGYLPVYLFDHNSSFGSEAELRSMIKTFKQKGTGILADVVINHRNNLGQGGAWTDYPAENYKGTTYQMLPSDICSNDDKGKTATWATGKGISLSSAKDTGEDWDGCRDIDHTSSNVRLNYNAYLSFLLEDLGYSGFRYDMVKGYAPSYTAAYNTHARPAFSVGEYWDNSSLIKQWIDGTRIGGTPTSGAFDFQFRYTVRDAVNNGNWSQLSGAGKDPLISSEDYKRYAVTFVENHDTQYRSAQEQLDPIKKDTLAANAFMLAMPGTPCVFLRHWQSYAPELKSMILARKLAGIANTSTSATFSSAADHYAVYTVGSKSALICVVGSRTDKYVPSSANYVEILSGHHYKYYLAKSTETAWLDVPSGEYEASFRVKAIAVSQKTARLVYTIDGTAPTPLSPQVPADGYLNIQESCTLNLGLLIDGKIAASTSRQYTIRPFVPYTATVYVRNENSWTNTYFYIWDSKNSTLLNGAWPGKKNISTRQVDGHTWHYQTVSIPSKNYFFNLVVTAGTSGPQTVDIPRIDKDTYLVISNQQTNGKHTVADVTSTITSIAPIPAEPASRPLSNILYDLAGRRISRPQRGQLYIDAQGQKILY